MLQCRSRQTNACQSGYLDMAGIIVTPRKEDFEKISTEDIRQILQEVGLPREDAQEIIKKYRKRDRL